MKNLLFIIIIVLITKVDFAQNKAYFDSPFGFGGGFLPSVFVPNMKPINEKISVFGTPKLSSAFFATGGAGYAYIGYVPGLRIGGIGIGGSTGGSTLVDGFSREVIYSSGFGGLTVEYTIPDIKVFPVSIGLILGAGSTNISISRHRGDFDWSGIWNSASNTSALAESYTRNLYNNYYLVAPTINIDIAVHRLVALRVGAGYSLPVGSSWKMDDNIELKDVPAEANGGGLFITTGIFLGFFSY